MRNHFMLRLLLLSSALCPAVTAAHADTISTFNFSATFTNGATGTGMVNVDVTTGVVTSLNIGVMQTGMPTYTFTGGAIQGATDPGYYVAGFDPHDNGVVLRFPQTSLVGYTGGQLCSTGMNCAGGEAPTIYGSGPTGNVNASMAALTLPGTPVGAPEIDPALGMERW